MLPQIRPRPTTVWTVLPPPNHPEPPLAKRKKQISKTPATPRVHEVSTEESVRNVDSGVNPQRLLPVEPKRSSKPLLNTNFDISLAPDTHKPIIVHVQAPKKKIVNIVFSYYRFEGTLHLRTISLN
jgi:hypothetical protein